MFCTFKNAPFDYDAFFCKRCGWFKHGSSCNVCRVAKK